MLRDDATTVCIDWYGNDEKRVPTAGASMSRASVV